jgi:phosphate-selective porin OprO/OprP
MKKIILAVTLLLTVSASAQVIENTMKPTKFGNGILNFTGEDNSWSIKMGARMQLLSTNNWLYDDGNVSDHISAAMVRRYRLKFDGFVYSPKVRYKLELGLSNHDLSGFSAATKYSPRLVLDAVVMWNFAKNWEVWFGQTKLPGNLERVISSANLQLVDRSRLNSEFTLDREFALQLRNHHTIGDKFVMREKFAVSGGEGRNVTIDNVGGHHVMGRLELLPFGLFESKGDYKGGDLKREKTPKLMLASTYSHNGAARKTKGSQGVYFVDLDPDHGDVDPDNIYKGITADVQTLFVDMMFKYRGFSFMGEWAKRDASATADNLVNEGAGLNLATGYLFKSNWEVAARYTQVDVTGYKHIRSIRDQYTVGVSRYVVGHKLKVQSDITYEDRAEFAAIKNNNRLGFRIQVEIQL